MQTGLIALIVLLIIFYGIPKIITGIVDIKTPIVNSEGQKLSTVLRKGKTNHNTVRKTLGEMYNIANMVFKWYDSYCRIEETRLGNAISFLSGEKNKLMDKMDKYVRGEWVPRFDYLKEIQSSFEDDMELYDAFTDFEIMDEDIRKCRKTYLESQGVNKSFGKMVKFMKSSAAIGAISGIAVVSMTESMINKAGKEMGNFPKSNARYQDPETGNLYDEGGNRVPF